MALSPSAQRALGDHTTLQRKNLVNWQAIGAVGETIGAIAVVVTLIYLAAQVRSGNRALTTTVRDSAFRQIQDWNSQLVADPDLPLTFQRGTADLESLGEAERARFVHVAYSFFKLFENLYMHHRDGSLAGEVWKGTKTTLQVYTQQPGLRAYWDARRHFFDEDFVGMVDSMEPSGITTGADLIGLDPTGSAKGSAQQGSAADAQG